MRHHRAPFPLPITKDALALLAFSSSNLVRLLNKLGEEREFRLSLSSDEILRIQLEGAEGLQHVTVPANSTFVQRVYVTARPIDPAAEKARTDLRFWIEDVESLDRASSRVVAFHGREQ